MRLDERRPRRVQSSRGTSSARCFRDARPRRDLHDGVDRPRAGARPHLAQALAADGCRSSAPAGLRRARAAGRVDSVSSTSSSRSSSDRRRQLGELRPERGAQPVALGRRLAQRERPPPRAAADEPRRERDLADRAARSRSGRRAAGRAGRRARAAASARCRPPRGTRAASTSSAGGRRRGRDARSPSPRQAPGAPAVRPQTFGDGAARQPGKLSEPLAPRAPSAPRCARSLEREQRRAAAARGTRASARRRRRAPAPAARRSPPRARRTAARPRRRARPRPSRPRRAPACSAGSTPP